jgi:hypothetical protein
MDRKKVLRTPTGGSRRHVPPAFLRDPSGARSATGHKLDCRGAEDRAGPDRPEPPSAVAALAISTPVTVLLRFDGTRWPALRVPFVAAGATCLGSSGTDPERGERRCLRVYRYEKQERGHDANDRDTLQHHLLHDSVGQQPTQGRLYAYFLEMSTEPPRVYRRPELSRLARTPLS